MISKKKTSFPAILPEETKLSFWRECRPDFRSPAEYEKWLVSLLYSKPLPVYVGGSAGQLPDRREYEKILLSFCSVCFIVYKIAIDCVQSMSIL